MLHDAEGDYLSMACEESVVHLVHWALLSVILNRMTEFWTDRL